MVNLATRAPSSRSKSPRQTEFATVVLGLARSLVIMVLLSSTVLSSLFGPILLAATFSRMLGPEWLGGNSSVDTWSTVITLILLISGSQATLIGAFIALGNRRLGRLYPLLPLFLAYHSLIAVAAWMALIDLALRPFYWAKTDHGKARTSSRALAATAV
jgi:hypothetical protein